MKRYITILLAVAAACGVATAQNVAPSKIGAKVDLFELEYHADSVRINLEFNLDALKIGVNESAVFTPMMFRGESNLELPTVVVRRRGGARSYERAMVLGNEKSIETYREWYGTPYKLVEFYGPQKQHSVEYSLTIPYEAWMVDSELTIDCATCGCCNIEDDGVITPNDNSLLIEIPEVAPYEVNPSVELVKPEKVAVKRRDIAYSAALIFKVNSTYIDRNLESNSEELGSIDEMMQPVISDSDYTITKVNIIGYASPEGSLAANMRLSEGRAGALESLMKRQYRTIKPSLYSVKFGGENWDKLAEIVEQSDLEERDDILDIIENISIEDGREHMLMMLNGGRTYKYLNKNIFPATRLVVVDVEYNVDAYDLDRIGELIDTKPQNLSLEEMYRLSETYEVEDEEFEKIFLTAVKIHPDDEVAQNNALVTEIRRGNIAAVEELVSTVNRDTQLAELANSLGVYYMMLGDYEASQSMLQRAIELECPRAEANMMELKTKLANLQQIEESEAFRAKIYGE